MEPGKETWRIRGFGARWQFGIFHGLIRLGGRYVAYLLADLVCLWYTLASPSVRRRCRPYLEHRFPERRGLARWVGTFHLSRTFARLLVDQAALRLMGPGEFKTELRGKATLNGLLADGKGLIIVTAHVGAWQLGMANLSALDRPISTLARFEAGDHTSPFQILADGKGPFRLIDPEGFLGGVPDMVGVLQRGEVLCVMGDRAWGSASGTVPATFLGGTIQLPYTAYKLASATGAPVAILFPFKPGPDQYEMQLAGTFQVPPGLGRGAQAYAPYAARFAGSLEAFLADHPYHFFNFFDLWQGLTDVRFLLLPGNNSLSHLTKGLAVREALLARGHHVDFTASAARSPFLASLGIAHHVLPDLQEADLGGAPSFAWFRQPERFLDVVRAERALMAAARPDRVLGIFRFTATASAAREGLPCDTLACGCMIPPFQGVLGFRNEDPEAATQRGFLDAFFGRAAKRLAPALRALDQPVVTDVRALLLGRRTYLWDTPGFEPLAPDPALEHVGPLAWERWPERPEETLPSLDAPLAVLSLGTALPLESAPGRILERLLALGYHVAIAGGGFPTGAWNHPRITAFRFAPMASLLARAELMVCHGGQQTVFESLAAGVPVAVFPFHPEQAQNGLCLERLGAGTRLVPSTVFWGSGHVYAQALEGLSDADLDRRLLGLRGRSVALPDPHLNRAAELVADRLGA